MQQLISIPPSKHAGARVVAAKTTSRNVCLSCILDSQKREMIKTDRQSQLWPNRYSDMFDYSGLLWIDRTFMYHEAVSWPCMQVNT